MTKVQIQVEVADVHFRAYEREAERRGVPVATLVEQTVNCLMREMEHADLADCVEERATTMS